MRVTAAVLVVGASGQISEGSAWRDIVEHVNSNEYGWAAQVPARFGSLDDVPEALGAYLPGDMEYEEPDVIQIPPSNGGLPSSFDAASHWPQCTVIANVRDQSTCGSCWAFASTESFEGRRCIATGEDIHFSTEDTAFCQPLFGAGHGCNGGNSAWSFFTKQGVVTGGNYGDTSGCLPYSFAPCAHHVPATADYPECDASESSSPRCSSSCSVRSYPVSYKNDKHMAARAYSIRTPDSMQQDLVAYGPMYVAFSVYSDFPAYKSGVYRKTRSSGKYLGGHAVCLVGYGVQSGTDYWKIKNSWNSEWGDAGHFKIVRGTNECGIEGSASGGSFASTTVV